MSSKQIDNIPEDPIKAFAYLVSGCASGLFRELIDKGRTDTHARNQIIHYFLDFAAGEACRIALREGRQPDRDKWLKAVNDAFDRAVKRSEKQAVNASVQRASNAPTTDQ